MTTNIEEIQINVADLTVIYFLLFKNLGFLWFFVVAFSVIVLWNDMTQLCTADATLRYFF